TKGLMFGETNLALQAAIEGQGVVLSSNVLTANDIAAGRLVRLFDVDLPASGAFGYYVVAPRATWNVPKIAAFRDWLLAEAAADSGGRTAAAAARAAPTPRKRRRG